MEACTRPEVVDAKGNLRVPEELPRTRYQALGTWAIAADSGRSSKEMHEVYASPGAIDAYRKSGQRFPDGTVLVKEILQHRHSRHDHGHGESYVTLPREGLVRDGEGRQEHPAGKQAVGRWLGTVVVRRRQTVENDIDELQDGLPGMPRAGTVHELDLRSRVPPLRR